VRGEGVSWLFEAILNLFVGKVVPSPISNPFGTGS